MVFKLNKTGKETVLYSFTSAEGGPDGGLVRDTAGNFYGTTFGDCKNYFGTVFKLDTKRNVTILYTFSGGNDGACPLHNLVLDAAGNIYGVTPYGGTSGVGTSGYGTLFKLDKHGNETVLYNFTGGSDGANPYAGLIRDNAGALYGTTSGGGTSLFGTVFKLTP
jgi:uncharacterized repeat protein (TIGR03803 family)